MRRRVTLTPSSFTPDRSTAKQARAFDAALFAARRARSALFSGCDTQSRDVVRRIDEAFRRRERSSAGFHPSVDEAVFFDVVMLLKQNECGGLLEWLYTGWATNATQVVRALRMVDAADIADVVRDFVAALPKDIDVARRRLDRQLLWKWSPTPAETLAIKAAQDRYDLLATSDAHGPTLAMKLAVFAQQRALTGI